MYLKLLRQIIIMSKYTLYGMILQVFCLSLLFAETGKAQNESLKDIRLTVNWENARLQSIFHDLNTKTGFKFNFHDTEINVNKKVTMNLKENSMDEVLRELSKEADLKFRRVNGNIHVAKKDLSEQSLIEHLSYGDIDISGKVTDENGEGLPGASVLVKGTSTGTTTGLDGTYKISVEEQSVLTISFVGYKTQEIAVTGGQTVIDLQMTPDAEQLEEVVVVGYGTQQRKEITGAVSSVSGDEISRTNSASLDQALQGKAAGVFVTSNSGQPGGGVSVRVRGFGGINNSEPLYVIDGVPMQGNALNDSSNGLASINYNDIESIEVLKDAASGAIYGARGANGVVLITTKSGKEGRAKINYSTYFGTQSVIQTVDVLNATQYAQRYNATQLAADPSATVKFTDPISLGTGTNWVDELLVDAPMQEHQLSMSGGTSKTDYYMSLNYFDQKGIIRTSDFKRYSFRLNTNNQLNSRLKVGNTLLISRTSSTGVPLSRGDEGGVFSNALIYSPTIPVRNVDGSFAGPPDGDFPPRPNPVGVLENREGSSNTMRALASLYGEVKIFDGLKFRTNLSVDYSTGRDFNFSPVVTYGTLAITNSTVSQSSGEGRTWIWENILSYEKDFKDHSISVLAGYSAQEGDFENLSAQASYTDNEIKVVSNNGINVPILNGYTVRSSLISQFGRVNYNYKDRYLLTANIRRDGSSKFGGNNRYGLFPSFSLGWRITEEGFFPKNDVVSDVKLRGGYGEVGFNAIRDFVFLTQVQGGQNYPFGGVNGTVSNGSSLAGIANPDVQWETVVQSNIGLDIGFFEGKLNLSVDYFKKERTDMLLEVPVSSLSGFTNSSFAPELATVFRNVGSLENTGLELFLSYKKKTGDFTYDVSANLTTYNNNVNDIGPSDEIFGLGYRSIPTTRTAVGQPVGTFYGYVVEGIFQNQDEVNTANLLDGETDTFYQLAGTAPGDFKYKDINGDNVITDEDRTDIGSPIPDLTYGLNAAFGYKNFDLSISFQGVYGNEIFNVNRSLQEASGKSASNKTVATLNSWNGEGTSNTIPRAIATDPNQNSRLSSAYIEDGSYLRLKNLQIGYNMPQDLINGAISSLRVYVGARNLLTFTDYSGFDPEIGNAGGSNLSAGVDNDVFPQARTFLVGLNVSF